jgi:solute:Na+ symporter, SSS family
MTLVYVIALAAFLAILAASGLRHSRRIESLEGFFLASRRLSPGLMALSMCSAWFGASSILVSADEAFRVGISAFWVIGLPAVLTLALFAGFLVRRIHDLPVVSLSDLVELRYGRTVRSMATVLIVGYMVALAASQMIAAGRFLTTFIGTSYIISVVIATAVVFLYSTIGGLLAVARADRAQFYLLVAGIGALLISLLTRTSFGVAAAIAELTGKNGYFDFFHGAGKNALIVLSFTMAWTISPIAWQRIQSVRTARGARNGLWLAAGLLAVLYAMITASGILFLPLFEGKSDGSLLMSRFIAEAAGPVLGVILFTAVMAAILSTMDAAIHTGALSLTRDVFQQVFPRAAERRLVGIGRWSTFAVGSTAMITAFGFQDIFKMLGLASQIMTEGLFIPGIAMLYLKKRLPLAGFLSLFLGGGFSIVSFLCSTGAVSLPIPEWPAAVPCGLALGAGGFLLGAGINLLRPRTSLPR